MNKKIWILLLLSIHSLVSCTVKNGEEIPGSHFSSGSVSESVFEDAGLFAEVIRKSGPPTELLSNERFVLDGTNLSTDKCIYLPEDAKEIIISAYQPYSPEADKSFSWTLPADQSKIDDFLSADILTATDTIPYNGTWSLDFQHIPAEIRLDVKASAGRFDSENIQTCFCSFPVTGNIDLKAGSINPGNEKADIKAYISNFTETNFSASVRVLPGMFEQGEMLARIYIQDEIYNVYIPENLEMMSGNRYVLKVNVITGNAEPEAGFTIEEWEIDEVIEAEPDIDTGKLSVTDVNGNKYPVERFGNHYWMLQNLRVRNYNDGSPIQYIPEANDETWNNLTEGAFCCYNDAVPSSDPNHFLYNFYAIETGKICPEGWSVPSMDEWLELAAHFGGEQNCGLAMKSVYGWSENGNGTNESGMNIIPIGAMEGWFRYAGTYAYLWTSSYKEDDASKARAVYFSYNSNAMKSWSFGVSKIRGYAIRCVKTVKQ